MPRRREAQRNTIVIVTTIDPNTLVSKVAFSYALYLVVKGSKVFSLEILLLALLILNDLFIVFVVRPFVMKPKLVFNTGLLNKVVTALNLDCSNTTLLIIGLVYLIQPVNELPALGWCVTRSLDFARRNELFNRFVTEQGRVRFGFNFVLGNCT